MTSHKRQTTQKWHCNYSRRFLSWWWQFQIKLAQYLSQSIFLSGSSKCSLRSGKSNWAPLASSIIACNKYSTVGPQLEAYDRWYRIDSNSFFSRCDELIFWLERLPFNKHKQIVLQTFLPQLFNVYFPRSHKEKKENVHSCKGYQYNLCSEGWRVTYPRINPGSYPTLGASQVAPVVKNPPAKAEDIRDAGSVQGSGW